jgi:hypothetical protein
MSGRTKQRFMYGAQVGYRATLANCVNSLDPLTGKESSQVGTGHEQPHCQPEKHDTPDKRNGAAHIAGIR